MKKAINRILPCLIAIAVILFSQLSAGVIALSPAQQKIFGKDILYYNVDECNSINATNAQENGAGDTGPVYVLGDSIAEGAYFDTPKELKKAFDNKGYDSFANTSVSRSISGAGTTRDQTSGLQAINDDMAKILESKPKTIIIALGTNQEDNFEGNIKKLINKVGDIVKKGNDDSWKPKIYWVNIFSKGGSHGYETIDKDVINQSIKSLSSALNYSVIDTTKSHIGLSDSVHPTPDGYKKYAQIILAKLTKDSANAKAAGDVVGSPTLDGHDLPATKGGTGLEDPITADGHLVGKTEKVTFPGHASLGQEYRDYYITMRWNYVKWNWDGTTTDSNDSEFNWFRNKPRLVLVTNPDTKKSIIAVALESGPAPWTGVDGDSNNDPKQGWTNPQRGTPDGYKGRVSGLPPQAFKSLGMDSNDQRTAGGNGPDLQYAWAPDQKTKPGPTSLSLTGETAPNECSCQADGSGSAGGDVDKFIKALAYQESGGDPHQPGSAGSARGKYQYIDSTWKSSLSSYYPEPTAAKAIEKWPQANLAPESVQDAVAFLEYSKKFKDFNNDLFKLAVSHFYPAANDDPGLLDIVPQSNVITPRQYASKLINSIKNGGAWEQLPLKYADAPNFSKYAKRISVSAASIGDPTGGTLAADLCSTEGGGDNADGSVDGVSWPVDKKYWDQNSEMFTKPHHDYPAADIPVASGTKVYSMVDGDVILAGDDGDCGTGVFIKYEGGVEFGYCHGTPGSVKVAAGDHVRSGQLIMLSDHSGHVIAGPGGDGSHLHVQIKVNGELRCPQDAFQQLAKGDRPDFANLTNEGCFY